LIFSGILLLFSLFDAGYYDSDDHSGPDGAVRKHIRFVSFLYYYIAVTFFFRILFVPGFATIFYFLSQCQVYLPLIS